MSEPADDLVPSLPPVYDAELVSAPPPEPVGPRGHPILAWLVILLLVAGVTWLQHQRQVVVVAHEGVNPALLLVRMQARYLVGAADLFGQAMRPALADQARRLNTGPAEQRLLAAVVTGELAGPQAALDQLRQLTGWQVAMTADQ